MKTKKF